MKVFTKKQIAEINKAKLPALKLISSKSPSHTKIGGLPYLPQDFNWPVWKNRKMSFLAQIDFAELPDLPWLPGLPEKGCAFFFYDQEQGTWGFDPKDKGSWKVHYSDHYPEDGKLKIPDDFSSDLIYNEVFLKAVQIETLPDLGLNPFPDLELSDEQEDAYYEMMTGLYGAEPVHQMFAYPFAVQNPEMNLEAQLLTNGLYLGDSSGWNDPKAKKLESGKDDWILLLQIDSDNEAGMMWGDMGRLYFWIKKEDLKNAQFDNVWMILQCY